MNLCFSTLGCVEKSWCEILELARCYGIGGLEIRGANGTIKLEDIEELQEKNATNTKNSLKENGTKPIVLGTSCMLHSPQAREAALPESEAAISVAEGLNIPYIRVFGNNLVGDRDTCIRGVSDGLKDICRMACDKGVTVLLEVHGDFNTVENLSPIIDAMRGVPNFGLIWDIAHTHSVYGDSWQCFYEAMRPYIRHVHIKDKMRRGGLTMIGKGDIPISSIVKRMLSDGYDGYFSLEWERFWHPELPSVEKALDAFSSIMKDVKEQV